MDIDDRRWTWKAPETPLLHTKGQCGAAKVPVLDIPETAVNVEIVLNNLSPTAHNIHMHGMLFQVRSALPPRPQKKRAPKNSAPRVSNAAGGPADH